MSHSSRLSLIFSCIGHVYIHLFTAFYFVIVLALEVDWQQPYHELVELWTLGALLVGIAALPAGWLGDRWSASGMMAVFFVGMGIASILAGLAQTPMQLLFSLAGIGLFAAIYHPIGIPWLVRNTDSKRGKILAINGIFGSLGSAVAGIVAGFLIDLANWRVAFILPGIICVLTGFVLVYFIATGRVTDGGESAKKETNSRNDMARVFVILLFTMFIAGMIFHSIQTSLPKVFEQRHNGIVGDGAAGIGMLVAFVYTVSGLMQLVGGYLADRFPLKFVYLGALGFQIPFLWLAAGFSGVPLVAVATLMVMSATSALPAENMLLAKYTPAKHHGLAFGIKFVLYFAAAPLAVQFVARVNAQSGEFYWVFAILAIGAACITLLSCLLPRSQRIQTVPVSV